MDEGLTGAVVTARRREHGPNVLPAPRRRPAWLRFAGELVHFFALMLWAAAALAYVAGLPALTVAIALVVVVNGAFAFLQEHRADRAAERLRAMLPTHVSVRRDGRPCRVDAADVVVGDLLLLDAGDRVPADAELHDGAAMLVDESMLTGESRPVARGGGASVHAGTFVVEGAGEATVTAIGAATRLGAIARLTIAAPLPKTPLTKSLRVVVRTIAAVAVGVGLVFFAVSLLLGNDASDGFVFAIGVTVALVPEALLPTVTLSLAWGAEQMAKRQVLVRHLEAVETLGSTTFVCTDKTGTLTQNRMAVVVAWTPHGEAIVDGTGYEPTANVAVDGDRGGIETMARAAARCGSGIALPHGDEWVARGDPMEAAIDAFARRLGVAIDEDRRDHPDSVRWSFDPRRRRMSVRIEHEIVVKGAPDAVLPRCGDLAAVEDAGRAHEAMTSRGLRVLAVARRPATSLDDASAEPDAVERDLELLGLVGLEDPPRPDVAQALEACRRAGVRVAMVTGDHPDTARAVATEVGLRSADSVVLTGAELPEDDDELGRLLEADGMVIARVSPEQKLRIAHVLQARGHVVAMTGDGVNDAPALHDADIGIAMGRSGTDVAREAADLVLLDDHFATIVAGIEQGRATYVNIRRFLTYHLTDNVAELTPFVVWVLSGGRFPLALGVLQILALDIGTDTLSAVALGAEPPSAHLLDGGPVRGRLMNHTVVRRAFALLGPVIAVLTMAAFVVSLVAAGWWPGEPWPDDAVLAAASGAAFITVVFGQVANAFACRSSTRRPGQLGWTTNRLLLVAIPVDLAFAFGVLAIDPIARVLDQAWPSWWGWVVALASVPIVLAVDAVDKAVRSGRHAHRQ